MRESFCSLRKFCPLQIVESISKYHATTKRTKDTKDSEIITFQFSSFVLFATFVVKYLFRFLVAALPRWGLRGGIAWLACFLRLLAE